MELYEKYFVIKEILTPACHASTIYKKKNGEILTAWFGGSREGADDVEIFLSRKSEGTDFQIAEKMAGGQEPHWNPVLFSTNDQKIVRVMQRMISPVWTEDMLETNLKCAAKLAKEVPIYYLLCTKEPSAAYVMKARIDKEDAQQ